MVTYRLIPVGGELMMTTQGQNREATGAGESRTDRDLFGNC